MYYSQFGEDRVLAGLFAGKNTGSCVEVGANNGVDGSATLYFEERGWACVLVEPVPSLCGELRRRRTGSVFECAASSSEGVVTFQVAEGGGLAHAVSAIGGPEQADYIRKTHGHATHPVEVRTRRLDDILEEAALGEIDFLTLDVEGHELEALKGFSLERWKPKVVIIEDNTAWGDQPVIAWMRARGYERFKRTGVNDWYARRGQFPGSYVPSMLSARLFMWREKVIAPFLPAIRRMPAVMWLKKRLAGG
jgi:FkbM family methyltransferase